MHMPGKGQGLCERPGTTLLASKMVSADQGGWLESPAELNCKGKPQIVKNRSPKQQSSHSIATVITLPGMIMFYDAAA